MMHFVNREQELAALEDWWSRPDAGIALLWGRRRVGKTALAQRFAEGRRTLFHTASSRPPADELEAVSRLAVATIDTGLRDLAARPFTDWIDALETLAESARQEPLLLVLDEFPELLKSAGELEGVLRAVWDRVRDRTGLRILLCGSATRVMEKIQEERAPLYGRADLRLLLHPFRPHEAAAMLGGLDPADRALVWGLVGGVPLYLEWWNTGTSIEDNLTRLVCTPGGRLLTEGAFVLATEGTSGDLSRQVLSAIASGRTRYNEIESAVRTPPARVLESLVELRLVERVVPVTEDPRRTRRRIYRIADNFLAFWLGVVERYRAEIERGLGRSILDVLRADLDDHLGSRWEEAFRMHLRRMAADGALGRDVVAVGPFWGTGRDPGEIDAVVLAGRSRTAILVGEAKWAHRVDGRRTSVALERKSAALRLREGHLEFAVCAREEVTGEGSFLRITATDIFG